MDVFKEVAAPGWRGRHAPGCFATALGSGDAPSPNASALRWLFLPRRSSAGACSRAWRRQSFPIASVVSLALVLRSSVRSFVRLAGASWRLLPLRGPWGPLLRHHQSQPAARPCRGGVSMAMRGQGDEGSSSCVRPLSRLWLQPSSCVRRVHQDYTAAARSLFQRFESIVGGHHAEAPTPVSAKISAVRHVPTTSTSGALSIAADRS